MEVNFGMSLAGLWLPWQVDSAKDHVATGVKQLEVARKTQLNTRKVCFFSPCTSAPALGNCLDSVHLKP